MTNKFLLVFWANYLIGAKIPIFKRDMNFTKTQYKDTSTVFFPLCYLGYVGFDPRITGVARFEQSSTYDHIDSDYMELPSSLNVEMASEAYNSRLLSWFGFVAQIRISVTLPKLNLYDTNLIYYLLKNT